MFVRRGSATSSSNEKAGRENHDAKRPDVRHPNVERFEFAVLAGEFRNQKQTHPDVGKKYGACHGLVKMRR